MMDNPLIRPTNHSSIPQAPHRTTRITGDTPGIKSPHEHGDKLNRTENSSVDKAEALRQRSIESLLPLAILERPELQQTEWAWRRVVIQMLSESLSQATATDDPMTREADNHPLLETLWSSMVQIAANSASKEWAAQWNQAIASPTFVPFSDVKEHHFKRLPEKVQNWILADRLQSSVELLPSQIRGEGLFLMPASEQNHPSPTYRWRAERQSQMGTNGHMIHRLKIECEVNESPVELTVIFAKPALMVHAATDDALLRQNLERRNSTLKRTLQGLGFSVDRFTIGGLSEERNA